MKTKKAAASTAAGQKQLQKESYQSLVSESIAKLQIGTLLLALQSPLSREQQKICWTLFEARFRDYVDQKLLKGQ